MKTRLRCPAFAFACVSAAVFWSTSVPVAIAQWSDGPVIERTIDAHLDFLASDALGGRETGTRYGDITARYIAACLQASGLEPAGADGTYLQPYDLSSSRLMQEACELSAAVAVDSLAFTAGTDYALRGYGRGGFSLAAGATFVGYGRRDGEAGIDDYAGVSVEGRLVVALDGSPSGPSGTLSWRSRREAAQALGAAGLLVIIDPESRSSTRSFNYLTQMMGNQSLELWADEEPGFPFVAMTSEAARRLLGAGGVDLDTEWRVRRGGQVKPAKNLREVRVRLTAPVSSERLVAQNVAAMIRGSDPLLADEVVVMSAHMDHIGTTESGVINNGADDNASGTTTLLTVAEVLASGPAPRRSVLLLAVSGEEKGLLGSEHWVSQPTVPLERIIGNINIDMVGRNAPHVIGATPSPTHADYNTLVTRAVELAPEVGLTVEWVVGAEGVRRRVDQYYQRSDHANFARVGIPVVFFFSGEHEDYHQPTDTADKIDRGKLGRMVRFIANLVTAVANDDQRPSKIEP